MTYMLWQMRDEKEPLPDNIRKALEFHEKKYGVVPNVVELSKRLDPPAFEGVSFRLINIPKNILLIGVE